MKWKEESYGFESLDLGLFIITVGWEKSRYYYSYLRVRSKRAFDDLDSCKEAAEESVVRRLRAALGLFG